MRSEKYAMMRHVSEIVAESSRKEVTVNAIETCKLK